MAERHENILSNLGEGFTRELEAVVQQVLISNGVKKNSDLANSIEWKYTRDSLLMYVNDYYRNVSEGRKPQARKIPINALIVFIKKNNIRSPKYSTSDLAFMMQRSIYKNGLQGKHFLDTVEESVTDTVEIRVADNMEQFIGDSLHAAFKVK